MRFQVGQTVFGVHFAFNEKSIPLVNGMYRQPYLYNDTPVAKINFSKLTVTEHHKVRWDQEPDSSVADRDGYLLKSQDGTVFANQYPNASYGQVSDTMDRRFRRYLGESGKARQILDKDPSAIFEYHLLSEALEDIEKGIKELGAVPAEERHYEKCQAKRKLLMELQSRITAEFHQQFPEYELTIAWVPAFKGSSVMWPEVTFTLKAEAEAPA